MATLEKRGEYQWRARVRKKGWPPQSRTFMRKKDAVRWAKQVELDMERGIFRDLTPADGLSLHSALDRYLKEVTPRKKGHQREEGRIRRWQRHKLSKVGLSNIRPSDLAEYRDQLRSEGKAENTIRLELALLSSLFETAKKDWGFSVVNPVREIKLPGGSKARERRLEDNEEEYLLLGLQRASKKHWQILSLLVRLAIETGMRQGELLRMEWTDVDTSKRIISVPESKSGDPRDVPLSFEAMRVLKGLKSINAFGRVFRISQDRLIRLIAKACLQGRQLWEERHEKVAPKRFLEDLKFHDLRHEAASRIAEKLEAHELAKMFGWKTMQMALRYYHPRAIDIARKLG